MLYFKNLLAFPASHQVTAGKNERNENNIFVQTRLAKPIGQT